MKRKNYLKLFLLCLIIVVPLLNINKGVDLSDTGYILNSYKFVFDYPETVNFSIILTSMIGGGLLKFITLLGIPSYTGMKVITVVIFLITIGLSFFVLRRYFNEIYLLVGFLIAEILAMGHISTLMYTHLSAVFFIFIGLSLIEGVVENKKGYIFLAGLLFGVNIFIRISNAAGLILCGLFIYDYINSKSIVVVLKNILRFWIGTLLSISFVVITLCIIFDGNYLKNTLIIYLNEAFNSTDGHSVLDSIQINLNQGINGIFWIFLFFAILVIISYMLKIFKIDITPKKRLLYFIVAATPLIFSILKNTPIREIYIIDKVYEVFYSLYQPFTIIVAFFGIFTLYFLFKKGKTLLEKKQAEIYLIFLIIMLVMPMGSNQGFAILYQTFYIQCALLVPVIFSLLKNSKNYQFYRIEIQNILVKLIIIFLSTYFLCMLISRNTTYLYRDNVGFNMMFFNNQDLKVTMTRDERVSIIEEVLHELEPYKGNNKLITYGSIPLFSFLLNMPPFFDGFNGWIEMDQLSLQKMREQLEESTYNKEYPLILISNMEVNNSHWPSEESITIMNKIKLNDKKYQIISDYIVSNKYEQVYHGKCFTIYSKK